MTWMDALRKELIADLREVFDASGQETPQIVRDVIEYADSWLHARVQKLERTRERRTGMTKHELLLLLRLLSALESWAFSLQSRLPDYLHEDLVRMVERLQEEILK